MRLPSLLSLALTLLFTFPFILAPFRSEADETAATRRILLAPGACPVTGEHRFALVIGNTHYGGQFELKNPENDARAMATVLQGVGFDTTLVLDASRDAIRDAVHQLRGQVLAAGPNSVALLYYSGHGMQVDGKNYLIPVGFQIPANSSDMDDYAYPAQKAIDELEDAQAQAVVTILDACRDSPYSGKRS
jgi:uncharacterized caspase-like protein